MIWVAGWGPSSSSIFLLFFWVNLPGFDLREGALQATGWHAGNSRKSGAPHTGAAPGRSSNEHAG